MRLIFTTLLCGILSATNIAFVPGLEITQPQNELSIRSVEAARTPSAKVNLLKPGDFENGKWGGWKLTDIYSNPNNRGIKSPGYQSKNAGFVVPLNAMTYSNIPVVMGMVYEFSLYLNMSDPKNCYIWFHHDSGRLFQLGSSYTAVVRNTWFNYSQTFLARTKHVEIYMQYNCLWPNTAIVEVDNIQLISAGPEVYSAKSTPVTSNLLVEPNFESGTLDKYHYLYTNPGGYSISSPGYNNATYALDASIYQSGRYFEIDQDVTLTAGKIYRITIAYKYIGTVPTNCTILGGVGIPGYTTAEEPLALNITFNHGKVVKSGKWTVSQGVFQAYQANQRFGLDVRCDIISNTIHWRFGGLELVEVTE